jgi:hypothetical protein
MHYKQAEFKTIKANIVSCSNVLNLVNFINIYYRLSFSCGGESTVQTNIYTVCIYIERELHTDIFLRCFCYIVTGKTV